MRGALLFLSICMSATCLAGERETLVAELMKAQGLLEIFDEQLELGRQQGEEQGQAILRQLLGSLNPDEEFKARFEGAFSTFMKAVETPWSSEEIVAVWAEHYGRHFTDQELRQLLAHYQTPLAQKEVNASRQALFGFSAHFAELGKPIMENALARYIENLKLIARECNCSR